MGDSEEPWTGWTATSAGDVNEDGISDIALETLFEPRAAEVGVIRIISGKDGSQLSEVLVAGLLDATAEVRTLGKSNGEGCSDIFIDQPEYLCAIGAKNGSTRWTLTPDLSTLVSAMGDVDGDGCADLLVGGWPQSRDPSERYAAAVSGRSGGILWRARGRRVVNNKVPRSFAWSGCVAPDINDDGVMEAVVDTHENRLHVLSGRDGGFIRELNVVYETGGVLSAPIPAGLNSKGCILMCPDGKNAICAVSCVTGALVTRISTRYPPRVLSYVPDMDGDSELDVLVGYDDNADVLSASTGRVITTLGGTVRAGGIVDMDGDLWPEIIMTKNCFGNSARALGPDLWRGGQLLVLSGSDYSVEHRFDVLESTSSIAR